MAGDDFGFVPDSDDTFGFEAGEAPELGTDRAFPIQEQHPAISDAERFQIMSVGGGGEAAARMLKEKGLEVDHQGGMNFSVREPGGEWMVLDPEHRWLSPSTWELQDFTSDIAGDVGSIASMGYGAVKGGVLGTAGGFALGGPPGAIAGGIGGAATGAGLMGGAAQAARTGLGAATGLEPTLGEAAGDIGYEAAFGAGSELLGMAGVGIFRGIRGGLRGLRGGRLTQKQQEIFSAFPEEPGGALRSLGDIAEMPARSRTEVPGTGPVPFSAGRPLEEIPAASGGGPGTRFVYKIDEKAFNAKLAKEYFPQVHKDVEHWAAQSGAERTRVAMDMIEDVAQSSNTMRYEIDELLGKVNFKSPEPYVYIRLVAILSNYTSGGQKATMARNLARLWRMDVKGMSDHEVSIFLRRRMADDDFVYREAGRKTGVQDAFDPNKDIQQLVEETYHNEQARAALEGAPHDLLIEAELYGGTRAEKPRTKHYTKEPPFDPEESVRSTELGPFIAEESYTGTNPAGIPGRPMREFPATRGQGIRDAEDAAEREYVRRVLGDRPPKDYGETTGKFGPLVDVFERGEQMFKRRVGKGTPKDPKGYPAASRGRGAASGGPQGGMVPRAEAIDFWKYLEFEKLHSLRIGGREVPLTQPQEELVRRTIYTMAVSDRSAGWSKVLERLAQTLQLPRSLLKASMTALKLDKAAAFLTGTTEARGGVGALAGLAMGGPGGAVTGAVAELAGRGVAEMGRQLMREPNEEMLKKLIQKAVKRESSRAASKLQLAQKTLQQYGRNAFRAMIYDAMHDPQVRQVMEE